MTQLDQENVWKIVKEIRKTFLSQQTDQDCNYDKYLLSVTNIKNNIQRLSEKLKLNPQSIPNSNVSFTTLENAAKMFTYLNYCPPKLIFFISHLLNTATPRDIVLAFSSLKTISLNALKPSTIQMFSKIMESLGLNNYENIQLITQGKCYNNSTYGSCTKKTDVVDKEDLKVLGKYLLLHFQKYEDVLLLIYFLGSESLKKVSTHPVHIVDKEDLKVLGRYPLLQLQKHRDLLL